jgi:hypothetical protein
MPRGQLTKDIIKYEIIKIKTQLDQEEWSLDPKGLAHKYIIKVLDKLNEYAR